MSLSLYNINEEIKLLNDLIEKNTTVNEETGEIITNESAVLEELEKELTVKLNRKALGYRNVILNFNNKVDFAKKEIDCIKKYISKIENIQTNLKTVIAKVMQDQGIKKLELGNGATITLSPRDVYVYDEDVLLKNYPKFFKQTIETNLDKKQAKEAFNKGIITTGISTRLNNVLLIK